jgi:hypothetical protein
VNDFKESDFIAVFEITNGHKGYGNSNLSYKKQQLEKNECFITKNVGIDKKNLYNAALFVATNPETVQGFSNLLNSKKNKNVLFIREYNLNLFYKTVENMRNDQTLDNERKEFFSFLYSNIENYGIDKITEWFNKNNSKELEILIMDYEKEKDSGYLGKHKLKALKSYLGKIGFIRGALAENYAYEIFDSAFKENGIEDYKMLRRIESKIMLSKKGKNLLSKEYENIEIDFIIITKEKYFNEVLNYLVEGELICKNY